MSHYQSEYCFMRPGTSDKTTLVDMVAARDHGFTSIEHGHNTYFRSTDVRNAVHALNDACFQGYKPVAKVQRVRKVLRYFISFFIWSTIISMPMDKYIISSPFFQVLVSMCTWYWIYLLLEKRDNAISLIDFSLVTVRARLFEGCWSLETTTTRKEFRHKVTGRRGLVWVIIEPREDGVKGQVEKFTILQGDSVKIDLDANRWAEKHPDLLYKRALRALAPFIRY